MMSVPLSAPPLPSDPPEPPSPVDGNSTPPPFPQLAPFPSPLPPPSVPDITSPPPDQIAPFASSPVTSPPPILTPPVVSPPVNLVPLVPTSPVVSPPVSLVPPIPTSPVVLPPVNLVPPIPTPLLKPPPSVVIPTSAPPPPAAAVAVPPPAKIISTPIIPVSSSTPLPPKPPIPSKTPPFPAIPSRIPPFPANPSSLLLPPPPGLKSPSQPVVSLPSPANSIPPLPPVLASPSAYSSPPAEVLPAPAELNYTQSAPFPLESPITPTSLVKSPALPPLSNLNLPVNPGKSHLSTELIIGFTIFGVFLFLVLGVFCISYKKRRRRNPGNTEDLTLPKVQFENILKNVLQRDSQSITSGSKSALPIQSTYVDLELCSGSLSYDELAAATDGFSEANLIGEGGFGYVHKGVLRGGQEVAIKQLKEGSRQGEREFRAEVEIISQVHHKHLVSLKGYCISGIRRLLVYEFVPNNTLEFHLHGNGQPVLEWPIRLKIAIGSAKGLAYLHEDCNPVIVHRDIKASNVLLDHNFEAKVSDFGLAKSLSDARTRIPHSSTQVVGTFGYLAPEYATSGKVTEKSDVYSYGIMLLELITGHPPISDINSAIREALVIWARPLLGQALGDGNFGALVDPRLQNDYNTNEMARMVASAAACVRHSSWLRPRMSQQVARALEGDISIGDLNVGTNPGDSNLYGSRYSSSLNMPLENSCNRISRYSGTTNEYGLNWCSSSCNSSKEDNQQQTRG